MPPVTTPLVAAGFGWTDGPTGPVLVSHALASCAPHAFTTRALDRAVSSDSRAALGHLFAVPASSVVRVRQVHGATVVTVLPDHDVPGDAADAIVSTDPSRVIAVAVADCVPVLLADRERRVVAAAHAGWRGTVSGVVGAAVAAIADAGAEPGRLVAAIGPSIGPCCYQVDRPVRDAFLSRDPEAEAWFSPDGDARWKLDLWAANRAALVKAGVSPHAIHVARLCTFDHPGLCHSFRRDATAAGRMFGAIRLEPHGA
jgi:YfiH family protein